MTAISKIFILSPLVDRFVTGEHEPYNVPRGQIGSLHLRPPMCNCTLANDRLGPAAQSHNRQAACLKCSAHLGKLDA
jgi:hypothetical protein